MYLNQEVLTLNQIATKQVANHRAVLTEPKALRFKKRKVLALLKKHLDGNRFLMLGGGYRSGKSAVMSQLYASALDSGLPTYYINVSDFEILESLNASPDNIFKYIPRLLHKRIYVIIDDIDLLKDPAKTIAYWFDHFGDMIMIAASAGKAFWNNPEDAVKMNQRIRYFKLKPLDFEEFLYFKNADKMLRIHRNMSNNLPVSLSEKQELYTYYGEYAVWGGYPSVVLADTEEEKRRALTGIYSIIMDNCSVPGSETAIHHLAYAFRIMAEQNGGKLMLPEIAKAADLMPRELQNFIDYLQNYFVLDIVSPFHGNEGDEIRKTPLLYFTDNGLRNIIINKFETFVGRNDRATLTRAVLLQKIRKSYPNADVRYWKTVKNKSADFVVQAAYNVNLVFKVKTNCVVSYPRKQEAFTERYPVFLFQSVSFHPECPDAKPVWIL